MKSIPNRRTARTVFLTALLCVLAFCAARVALAQPLPGGGLPGGGLPPGGLPGGGIPPGGLPPAGTQIKTVGLYETYVVILDHLPVCVVYEPPGGAESAQDFTITNRFGTSTTITSLRTGSRSTTVGVTFKFLSGESQQSETWESENQKKTWRTVVETAGWKTGAHKYPGDGDLIVFYLRPQFEIELKVGEAKQQWRNGLPWGLPYDKVYYDKPIFDEMEPLRDETPPADPSQRTWVKVAATVAEIRSGTGNGQGLEDIKYRLLALDPFCNDKDPNQPRIDLRRGARVPLAAAGAGSSAASSSPFVPEYPPVLRENEDRYWYCQSYQWSPTGEAFEAGVAISEGQSVSNTVTHKTESKVKAGGSVPISTPAGTIKPAISVETVFSLQYSVNKMTEEERTTDARAFVGGGDGSDTSLYITDQYYDATFGTLAFTREKIGQANATGTVTDGSGGAGAGAGAGGAAGGGGTGGAQAKPRAGMRVVAKELAEGGRKIVTVADGDGNYRFALAAGKYQIEAADPRGRALSDPLSVEVPANLDQPLKLQPLRLKQALVASAARADEPPAGRSDAQPGARTAAQPAARQRAGAPPARTTRTTTGGQTTETQPTASEGDTATAIRGRPDTGAGPGASGDSAAARLEARLVQLEARVKELEARAAGGGEAAADARAQASGTGAGGTPAAGAGAGPGATPGATDRPTGPFGPTARGGAGGARGYVVTPNAALKGRLGRLVVSYPKEAKKADARVDVMKAGDTKSIKGDYGNFATELFPGRYDVVINKIKVPVEVVQGSDTRVKVGILRLNLGQGTRYDVVDDKGGTLVGDYGGEDVGLPAGTVKVKIADQVETVEIQDGKVTEF